MRGKEEIKNMMGRRKAGEGGIKEEGLSLKDENFLSNFWSGKNFDK